MKRLCLLAAGFFTSTALFASYYKTPYFPCHNNCSHFYMQADVGDYRLRMPGYSFGELLTPVTLTAAGPIEEFTISRDTVDCFYPRLALGVEFNREFCPCWVRNLLFEIGLFYTVGDKQDTPGNGTFTNFALPAVNGSGDFLADTILADPTSFSGLTFKRDYRYAGVQFKLGSDLNLSRSSRFAFTPFVEVDLDSLTQDYKLRIGSLSGGTSALNFALDEHVTTNYIDVGVGFDAGLPLSPSCNTFVLFGEAAVFVSGAHTRLKANESAILPLVPSAISSFYRNKHDAVQCKARGQVGVGYQFGYNFMASVVGQVDYWGYLPEVINPQRVAGTTVGIYDRAVHIEPKSTVNYALILSLTVTFF